jgi:hypothetical protein
MDLDNLTGAGGTLEVGGRTLTVSHLNAFGMGKLEAFVKQRRQRPMKRFLEEMKDLAPLKEMDPDAHQRAFDRLLLQAHEEEKLGMGVGEAMTAVDGVEAVAYTIWLMANPNHPEVTYEWVRDNVKEEDLPSLKKKVDFANMAWTADDGGGGQVPTKAAPVPG